MSKIILLVENIDKDGTIKCANTIAHQRLGIDKPLNIEDRRFSIFHDTEYFEFHTIDTANIDKDVKVIYYLDVKITQDHLNPIWVYGIRPETLKVLKEYNIPIIINETQEFFLDFISNDNLRCSSVADLLDKHLTLLGLQNNNLIINGIANLGDQNPYITVGTRKIFTNFSFYFFNRAQYLVNNDSNTKPLSMKDNMMTEKSKLSICINRQPREIRCALLAILETFRKNSIFTFLGEEPLHVKLSKQEVKQRFIDNVNLIEDVDLKQKALENIELLIKDFPDGFDLENNIDDQKHHTDINKEINNLRLQCYFETVTETHDSKYKNTNVSIITEKALWPILNHMPFIIVGHRANYRFLKKLGFNLFEKSLLTESDTSSNYEENLLNVRKLFERMSEKNLDDWVTKNMEACTHNYSTLINTDWKRVERDTIRNLLEYYKF